VIPEKHPGQMMVCHEHIDAKAASSVRRFATFAFCDLSAHGWCLECGYYVCDIHAASRHDRHRLQLVSDERQEDAE